MFKNPFAGMGDLIGLIGGIGGGNLDQMSGILPRLLSDPKLVNMALNKLNEAWDTWEKKEAYKFVMTLDREVLVIGHPPEIVVKVWAKEDGKLKPYKTFSKDNLQDLIKLFTDGNQPGNQHELSAPAPRQ